MRPSSSLTRDRTRCAWTMRADLARSVAGELGGLAEDQAPVADSRQAPVHAQQSVEDNGVSLHGHRRLARFASGRRRPGRCGEGRD